MKYSKVWLLIAMLSTSMAWADDFSDRLVQAQQAIKTPEGAHYDRLLMPYIQSAVNACMRQNAVGAAVTNRVTDAGVGGEQQFALVGAVHADGWVRDAQVRPQTGFSNCFAQQFSQLQLPNLNLNGVRSKVPHPIVVNVRVRFAQ